MTQTLCEYDVSVEPGFICLVDLDHGMSITNTAETVVNQLRREGFDLVKNRIIYQDTMGYWDELVVRDGHFVGFAPLRATSQTQAIQNARQKPCTAQEDAGGVFKG